MALRDVVSEHSVDGLGLDLMILLVFCNVNDSMVLLQTLLDLGASPDYKDSRGLTPLYHSAMVGGDPYCCELLLHDYARLGCVDENGWQEIHQVRWIWMRSAGPGPRVLQGAGGWWGLHGQQGAVFLLRGLHVGFSSAPLQASHLGCLSCHRAALWDLGPTPEVSWVQNQSSSCPSLAR